LLAFPADAREDLGALQRPGSTATKGKEDSWH
jgi:hypothetical protein